jgi:hypothetical protein
MKISIIVLALAANIIAATPINNVNENTFEEKICQEQCSPQPLQCQEGLVSNS